jgi:hypothetical protein
MNRHERRKARVFERKMIPARELANAMCQCAWKGCEAACKPDSRGDVPSGWSVLLLTRSFRHYANLLDIRPSECLRDAVLCPEHTRLLDSQLEDIGRELTGPSAGTA